MNWNKTIKQKVGNKKYPQLVRIKLGKALMLIVALPIGTSALFPLAAAMMIPISFDLWVKDKIRYLNDWRKLR